MMHDSFTATTTENNSLSATFTSFESAIQWCLARQGQGPTERYK